MTLKLQTLPHRKHKTSRGGVVVHGNNERASLKQTQKQSTDSFERT